jgi:hypothetical protein
VKKAYDPIHQGSLSFSKKCRVPNSSANKRVVALWIASCCAIPIAFTGCQAFGLRSDAMATLGDDDDWSLPSAQASQVPRPNLAQRSRLSDRNPEVVAYAPRTDESKNRKPAVTPTKLPGLDPIAATSSPSEEKPEVIDTNEQSVDVDGVLEGLPPQIRDVMKRQLAAAKLYESSEIQKTATKVSLNDNEERTEADKPSSSKDAPAKSTVSVRLSDDSLESSNEKPTPPQALATNAQALATNAPSASSAPSTSSIPTSSVATATTQPNSNHDFGVQSAGGGLPAALSPARPVLPASATTTSLPTTLPSSANGVSNMAPSAMPSPVQPNVQLPSTSPVSTPGAHDTAPAGGFTQWHQPLAHAIEMLEKQMRDQPSSDQNLRMHQELTLRLLYVSMRKLDDALRPIDGLPDHEQEYYRHQMQALYEASNPDAMPVRSRHLSLVMNSQREATNHLAAASNLEVRSVAFCTEVERYGVLTKFPKYQFTPDQEVLLYCELENVAAERVRDGFETQLQGSYEIVDSQGRVIAEQILPMEPDICQNHRRDYFIVYKIYMPQQISPGAYKLRLTVEDMKARKFGQSSLDLQIKK